MGLKERINEDMKSALRARETAPKPGAGRQRRMAERTLGHKLLGAVWGDSNTERTGPIAPYVTVSPILETVLP